MNAIELRFLKSQSKPYRQFDAAFIPQLSIIDALMFNGRAEIQDGLSRFELLTAAQDTQ